MSLRLASDKNSKKHCIDNGIFNYEKSIDFKKKIYQADFSFKT